MAMNTKEQNPPSFTPNTSYPFFDEEDLDSTDSYSACAWDEIEAVSYPCHRCNHYFTETSDTVIPICRKCNQWLCGTCFYLEEPISNINIDSIQSILDNEYESTV